MKKNLRLIPRQFKEKKSLREVLNEAVDCFSEEELGDAAKSVVIMVLDDNDERSSYCKFSKKVTASEGIWLCESTKRFIFDQNAHID